MDEPFFAKIIRIVKQRWCAHEFAIEDLRMVNMESDGDDRVEWSCAKCGKSFSAHCGLDITPEHGFVFRRGAAKSVR